MIKIEPNLQEAAQERKKDVGQGIKDLTIVIQNLHARLTLTEHQLLKMENHITAVGVQIELVQGKVDELAKPLDKAGKMSIAKFIKKG